jgi:hypothetical protein
MVLAFIATIISISAFRQKDSTDERNSFREESGTYQDTTTPRKRNRTSDNELDDKIEKAMEKLEVQMKQLEEQIKKLDFSKMQKDLDASFSKVDFDKIGRQIDDAIKKVDWDKIEKDVEKNASEAVKINSEKIKLELEKVKQQMEQHKLSMKLDNGQIKIQVEKAMEQARENMKGAQKNLEKAKEELSIMREFTDELEKDGLVDKKKGYKIEVKDNELYLNGIKQPANVTEKYKKYFRKDNYSIISDGSGKARI